MKRPVTQLSGVAQWHELLSDAQTRAQLKLSEMLEHYLVTLLMRFTRRGDALCQVVAPNYLSAMAQEGRQQPHELRDVGDVCLLLSGLFAGRARKRLVSPHYYIDLGRAAYAQASNSLDTEEHPLFATLAERFVSAMDVLMAIRLLDEGNAETLLPDAISAHELWQRSGSASARDALRMRCDEDSLVLAPATTTQLH